MVTFIKHLLCAWHHMVKIGGQKVWKRTGKQEGVEQSVSDAWDGLAIKRYGPVCLDWEEVS